MLWNVARVKTLKHPICLHGDVWIPPGLPDRFRIHSALWKKYAPAGKPDAFERYLPLEYASLAQDLEVRSQTIKELPDVLQQCVEREAILFGTHPLFNEPLALGNHLPFSHLQVGIAIDGFTHIVCKLFGLFRLQGVKQLGYLCPPVQVEYPREVESFPFEHNRLQHIYDVMVVALLMGINARLSEKHLNTLLIAALTHDVLTPAGGDTTKAIDPVAFDEDAHYPAFLKSLDLKPLHARFPFDEELLLSTIRNEGVLGILLDIADKCYVFRDAQAISRLQVADVHRIPHSVDEVLRTCPFVGDIWECVRVQGEQVYFTDPLRLFHFLLLRARLFEYVYRNPYSRTRMHVLVMTVLRYLYHTQSLSREELITMQDGRMERVLEGVIQQYWIEGSPHPYVEVIEAKSRNEALQIRDLKISSGLMASVEKIPPGKAATHFLVKHQGNIVPFREACPTEAEYLDAIVRVQSVWWVFVHPEAFELVEKHRQPFWDFLRASEIPE